MQSNERIPKTNELIRKYPFASHVKAIIHDYFNEDRTGFQINFAIIIDLYTTGLYTTENALEKAFDMLTTLTWQSPSMEINDVEILFTHLQNTSITKLNFLVNSIYLNTSCNIWYDLMHPNSTILDLFSKQNSDAFKVLANNKKITDFVYTKWNYLCQEELSELETDFLESEILYNDAKDLLHDKHLTPINPETLVDWEVHPHIPLALQRLVDLATYFIKKITIKTFSQQQDFLKYGDKIVTLQDLTSFSGYKDHASEATLIQEIKKYNQGIRDEDVQDVIKWIIEQNRSLKDLSSGESSSPRQDIPEPTVVDVIDPFYNLELTAEAGYEISE